MPYETENRLKSYLDSNQLARERLCLSLLTLDPRFSNVAPRHPRGGRDGGVDITATYQNLDRVGVGIGFVNGANDSKDQKKTIKSKFREDAGKIIKQEFGPSVFVFFTNVDFTIAEKTRYAKPP